MRDRNFPWPSPETIDALQRLTNRQLVLIIVPVCLGMIAAILGLLALLQL